MQIRSQMQKFGPLVPSQRDMQEAVREVARELAEVASGYIRNIIAEETDGTGRLAASIGKYDDSYIREYNPESSPADSYWYESEDGSVYTVEYGTYVEYADAVENGWVIEEPRVIFLNGRFVTVRPQSFAGLYAFERGQAMMTPRVTQEIYNRKFREKGWR